LRPRVAIFAAALAAAGGAYIAFAAQAGLKRPPEAGQEVRIRMIGEASAAARPGDVLFKSGGGLWGKLAANFSHTDKTYGHVGVVARNADGALVVIHAGGDPVSGEGRVKTDALEHFLGASNKAALYRPLLAEAELEGFIAYAQAAAGRAAPFDTAFSLDTEDALYCTELVWRAFFAAAAADAVPDKSERSGKTYVALDDLQGSAMLDEVWLWRKSVSQ
jgi:hypothetical protein